MTSEDNAQMKEFRSSRLSFNRHKERHSCLQPISNIIWQIPSTWVAIEESEMKRLA
jgi:hypothetical protein